MKMIKLLTIKPHRYGTRHLTAGEEYEAPLRYAAAMVAARKARFAAKAPRSPLAEPVQAPVREPPPEPVAAWLDLDELRKLAGELGVDVDGRWGAARLQQEIAKAKENPGARPGSLS